jgi:hypothetical protein
MIRIISRMADARYVDHKGRGQDLIEGSRQCKLAPSSSLPALHAIFRDKDKIQTTTDTTDKGVAVVQTSDDPKTAAALQQHAAEVTDLVRGGMAALHTAMMRNGGMMQGPMPHGGMMRGPM